MPRLLIVDDEADVREFAANLFRRRNIDVDTAANGKDALVKVENIKPELILLDISMEGMDGIEVLERVKQIDQSIKVIMVTGKKGDEDEAFERCKKAGALDYIHKPLILDELERVVMNVLHKEA
ncbi:MAG: response regulator [Candidatus Colwellbacteria bacterium]|nr:response regulator [Candidatus Colwellbacteria bacterium]